MASTAGRRQQSPITIRSTRAAELLRMLVGPDRSQAQVIEEALEQMAARRRSLADLLTPNRAQDFDWEPPRADPAGRDIDLAS